MKPSGETGTRLSGGCSRKAAVELKFEERPDVMQSPGGSSRCRGLAERLKHGHSCGREDGGCVESHRQVAAGLYYQELYYVCVCVRLCAPLVC